MPTPGQAVMKTQAEWMKVNPFLESEEALQLVKNPPKVPPHEDHNYPVDV
jgi:hypothetical protein